MLLTIYRSLMVTVFLGMILCGAYPLMIYGVAHLFFKERADGQLIFKEGKIVGSKLIGQVFSKPEYFHGRPSFAGQGYDASHSSGSNLGPTNQKFHDTLKSNIDRFLSENPSIKKGEVPTEAITASASGLDPHISPDSAYAQLQRVAQARGVSFEEMKSLIKAHIEGPQLGLFGEALVNVLVLNLAMDEKYPMKKSEAHILSESSR